MTRMTHARTVALIGLALAPLGPGAQAAAQSLGMYRWQLQPYCNVVSVTITQVGNVYRLEGTDDQCGAATQGSVVGTAFPNPDGSIGLGFNIVATPGGLDVAVDGRVTLPSASGTWKDSAGASGTLVLTPGASSGGSPRPVAGTVGAVAVNSAQVQLRVTGTCPAGQLVQRINQDGTVTCAAGGSGGIATVTAGAGLQGGGTGAAVTVELARTLLGAYDLSSADGIVSTGTPGAGAVVPNLAGTRLVWNPRKAAFRAGRVTGSEWNDSQVGTNSAALGFDTRASGYASTALGFGTTASAAYSTATGSDTTASGLSSTAMGSITTASGDFSTAVGLRAIAVGRYSVVLGTEASTTEAAVGSFVYGDSSGSTTNFVTSFQPNQFLVRAAGGTAFWSSSDTTYPTGPGVILNPGAGAWSSLSDVNSKENFRDLADDDVLARVARLPVREWNYKSQDREIRHLGPTAQDFHAAFGLGEDARRISTVDADGVALAGVKALEARTRDLRRENESLREEAIALRVRIERLERLLGPR